MLVRVQRVPLAGAAPGRDAVHALGDQPVHLGGHRRLVQGLVVRERRGGRRDDAFERFGYISDMAKEAHCHLLRSNPWTEPSTWLHPQEPACPRRNRLLRM